MQVFLKPGTIAALIEDYRIFAAEQRACGYEVPSFEEWAGLPCETPRDRAEQRLRQMDEDDTRDLY